MAYTSEPRTPDHKLGSQAFLPLGHGVYQRASISRSQAWKPCVLTTTPWRIPASLNLEITSLEARRSYHSIMAYTSEPRSRDHKLGSQAFLPLGHGVHQRASISRSQAWKPGVLTTRSWRTPASLDLDITSLEARRSYH